MYIPPRKKTFSPKTVVFLINTIVRCQLELRANFDGAGELSLESEIFSMAVPINIISKLLNMCQTSMSQNNNTTSPNSHKH